MIVHALGGEREVPVALHLVAQRADLLAVAGVAALAHIDVAAALLERRIGAHAFHMLDRRLDGEQRHHLDDAADRDGDQGEHQKQEGVAFDELEGAEHRDHSPATATAAGNAASRSVSGLYTV